MLFGVGGLALAGLPPFGTALGKAVTEEAAGGWATALFVLVSAATGGAVLRAGARVFLGLGPVPESAAPESRPADDAPPPPRRRPERRRSRRPVAGGSPGSRTACSLVPTALLAGALAVGLDPALRTGVGRAADAFTDHAGYLTAVLYGRARSPRPLPRRTGPWPGCCGACWPPRWPWRSPCWPCGGPGRREPTRWTAPLRRLHSGHVGDYVAWFLAGITLLAALIV